MTTTPVRETARRTLGPEVQPDITVSAYGGLLVVQPLTAMGTDWLSHHVSPEATWIGEAVAVEFRYAQPVRDAMVADGLTVGAL